ncbi:Rtf2 RING-finger-domain-containing protein, partial [Lipomyces arxii]|uniref:Rtf2 RING-finger-domain-containing protein n=1 Tax=Lipomyces arxii TaxID=56418 RepID=UPI0034CF7885
NDGGSIPTRRELVKASAKEQSSSQIFEQNQLNAEFIWSTCRLSKDPLELPIVCDYMGRLYNKSALLEWLISPEKYGDGQYTVPHIKSMKDVIELKIAKSDRSGQWVCPITGKELRSGGTKFVCISECGHVFAERALQEIDSAQCLECNTSFKKDNIIILNPILKADIETLKKRYERLMSEGLTNSLKQLISKKKRK